MNFEEYQKFSRKTAFYPGKDKNFIYPTLGLAGETGEVAEKIKKIIRDDDGNVDGEKKEELKKELGDVLWYVAQIATELDISFDEIAKLNIEKLRSRKERNTLSGSGDNR
jgi:NTP pyrophosphatase (non-canonical NTP hydrolase)